MTRTRSSSDSGLGRSLQYEPVCSVSFSVNTLIFLFEISLSASAGLSHRYASLYAEDARPTPPSSGRSSPYSTQRPAEDLESQNDEQIEGLRAKVNMLKNVNEWSAKTHASCLRARQVTIGIGNEVKESTVQLSQMVCPFRPSTVLLFNFNRMMLLPRREAFSPGRFGE